MGRDIYKVDPTLGVARSAAMVDGKAMPVADVAERKWRVLAAGPVRSIGEFEYKGWKIGGKPWIWSAASPSGPASTASSIASRSATARDSSWHAALPKKPGIDPLDRHRASMLAVATWGHQVVVPGTKAEPPICRTRISASP